MADPSAYQALASKLPGGDTDQGPAITGTAARKQFTQQLQGMDPQTPSVAQAGTPQGSNIFGPQLSNQTSGTAPNIADWMQLVSGRQKLSQQQPAPQQSPNAQPNLRAVLGK